METYESDVTARINNLQVFLNGRIADPNDYLPVSTELGEWFEELKAHVSDLYQAIFERQGEGTEA